jgi:uncharacterized protein YjbJ (UPF0337 family)
MFVLTEAQAATIRATYKQRGELSAVVELRRLFPGVDNIALARECVRTIAGWCEHRDCLWLGNDRQASTLDHDRLREEPIMDREHVKGAADKVKGAVKDTAGKVTGDEKMQAEGKMDKAKGAAHNAAGDAKDTARDATR